MTRCLGACKPLLAVGVGRYNITLLDLLVGEPVAYATGLRLKAIGPPNTVCNSPITKGSMSIERGRTANASIGNRDNG